MSPRRRVRTQAPGSIVLDNEGVSKAANERAMYVRLKAAYLDGWRVLTSAAVLAELLRGGSRDAGVHRVLGGVVVEPVTREVGENAGRLVGSAGLGSEQAVDAMVAATALAEREFVQVVTSDVSHLSALLADHERITVIHVDKLNR